MVKWLEVVLSARNVEPNCIRLVKTCQSTEYLAESGKKAGCWVFGNKKYLGCWVLDSGYWVLAWGKEHEVLDEMVKLLNCYSGAWSKRCVAKN